MKRTFNVQMRSGNHSAGPAFCVVFELDALVRGRARQTGAVVLYVI